jgi:hypothetical protein
MQAWAAKRRLGSKGRFTLIQPARGVARYLAIGRADAVDFDHVF